MDWTHAHLALNHVPVIGTPFLFALLAWGWLRNSHELTRLALWWTIGLAVLGIALKFTGDFAAEQAQTRLEPVRSWVETHEQRADQATTAVFLLGLSAAGALIAGRKNRPIPRWAVLIVLVLGLVTTVMLAWTANSGGQIGHPQLRG